MNNMIKYQTRVTCELKQEPFEICKANWQKVIQIRDHESNLGEFNVYYCRRCKLGFTDPYPTEELSGFLYETKNSGDFDIIRYSLIDSIKDILSYRQIVRPSSHGHVRAVLDWGTGNGRFAASAAKAFHNAHVDAVDYQIEPPQLFQTVAAIKNVVTHQINTIQ